MRLFVRKSFKGGRCVALNQYYKSTISDQVLNIMSQDLGVVGNICEILEKYFNYANKYRKIIENEYDSQFDDCRDIDQEERTNYINKKLNRLVTHQKNTKTKS